MPEYYLPTDDQSLIRLVDDARRRNVKRDLMDHSAGHVAPGDDGPCEHLRTAICAIISGLSTCGGMEVNSANCIAEGIAMLQEIELKLRSTKPG